MKYLLVLLLSCFPVYSQLLNGVFNNGVLTNAVAPIPYAPNVVDFDGSNDYMTRGAVLTGDANGKKGTISVWLKFNSDAAAVNIVYEEYTGGSDAGILFNRQATYKMIVGVYSASFVTRLEMQTTDLFKIANGWQHFMASWDVGTASNHIYVNGTNALSIITASSDGTIVYNQTNHTVGGRYDGTFKMTACISDLLVSREYVDLSKDYNRRKFYNNGRPVDLGSDGSIPTGTAPIVFFKGTAASYGVNSGSGGNFTITGALTACGTAP